MSAVLARSWEHGIATKGDYAREHADLIAIAADQGLITTKRPDGEYGRRWLVTAKGLTALWRLKGRA